MRRNEAGGIQVLTGSNVGTGPADQETEKTSIGTARDSLIRMP